MVMVRMKYSDLTFTSKEPLHNNNFNTNAEDFLLIFITMMYLDQIDLLAVMD